MRLDNFRILKEEASKISWPPINEALISAGMVVMLMSVSAIFLAGVDYILSAFDRLLLTL